MSTMKQLMTFGAAALCAAVSLADVTSANVVGYQNKAYPVNGGSTIALSTFQKVDGSKITLKDIKVEGGTYTDNIAQFLTKMGSTDKFTYSDKDYAAITEYYGDEVPQTVAKKLFYINEADSVDMECTPGWYMTADYDCIVNVSTQFTVKSGEGFFYQPANAGAAKLVVPSAIQ